MGGDFVENEEMRRVEKNGAEGKTDLQYTNKIQSFDARHSKDKIADRDACTYQLSAAQFGDRNVGCHPS